MSALLLALIAGALLLAFLAFRRGAGATPPQRESADVRKQPFRCVSIREASGGCPAVAWSRGMRFLPDEAPTLPAPGCPSRICKCSYRHHADRRRRHQQRNAYDPRSLTWPERNTERRKARRGRRRDD